MYVFALMHVSQLSIMIRGAGPLSWQLHRLVQLQCDHYDTQSDRELRGRELETLDTREQLHLAAKR